MALEATGVYWRPVHNLLEDRFELLLVNPRHIKAVPGRKSDVQDAEWLADLLRHGLLRASFVPDRPQREVRDLTRYRTAQVHERARAVQRLQKLLESANIKLASVATDVLGLSSREMLHALIDGQTDPVILADLARRKLRAKLPQLQQALAGRFGPHQRFLLAEELAHIEYLEEAIERLNGEIAQRLASEEPLIACLDAIPGIGRRAAEILLAELGTDLRRFPSAAHLASWAGLCSSNEESAGKRLSTRTRKGNVWVRTLLVEAAQAAARTNGSYLNAQFRRLASRRGGKKAAVAVAHSLLVIIYHLLTRGDEYHDLGGSYFDERDRTRVQHRLVNRLEALGYRVHLEPQAA